MNPDFLFEIATGDKSKMGVYVVENRPEGVTKRFICGMEAGYMPEFSVQHTEEKRIPDPYNDGNWLTVKSFVRETRGWRTVLARLLREKLITMPQIDAFFNPAYGRDSERWQQVVT